MAAYQKRRSFSDKARGRVPGVESTGNQDEQTAPEKGRDLPEGNQGLGQSGRDVADIEVPRQDERKGEE